MATKYDIEPGTFETITNQEIGTFVLDQWQHIKLDGIFPFLMSNIVLKQGAVTIPGSAYELAVDTDATAQESGLTGDTLYGILRITNVAYVGVTLNISGSNFGTYVSNQAVTEFVTAEIAANEKIAPVPGFIEAGEPMIFENSAGLTAISDNSGEIAAWDAGTAYTVAGTLVRIEGITAAATGEALNQNKNPLDIANALFWYIAPDENDLLRAANLGTPIPGTMHTVDDYSSSNYQQVMKVGKKKIGGVQKELFEIKLDGTVVTGNTTLENLLLTNPYVDLYAPDNLGTRTLVDQRGRSTRAMTAGGGVAATLAEVQEDEFQGHIVNTGDFASGGASLGGFAIQGVVFHATAKSSDPVADAHGNGTPRTGPETRVKALVRGVDKIVAMQ